MPNPLDLSGQTFGRLTAVRPTERRAHGMVVWECACACGNTTYQPVNVLRLGRTRSCGCLHRESMRAVQAAARATRPPRVRRPLKARSGPGSERQAEALALRREGLTFAQIGERLGVSRQRAAQLVQAAEGESVWKPPAGEAE